jgi:mevalonate kinase
MRSFSAPGKLVLVGEYAVTDGFPAVVTAVSCRAIATLHDDDTVTRARATPLLAHVLREVQERGLPLLGARVSVSTTAFEVDGKKLGLGAAAAAAVAFASVFAHDHGADVVYDVARAAHRAFQGGGSGIDIAASTYGGLLRFHAGRAQPAPALPATLAVVVAWTGIPARTQGFVDAYRALAARERHARAMDAATTRFLVGASGADASEIIRAIADARAAMAQLGNAAGVDIVSAEHARIAELTIKVGGQAKPSGAGGGDVAVCFVPADARARLEQSLDDAGFPIVQLQLGEPGARDDRALSRN